MQLFFFNLNKTSLNLNVPFLNLKVPFLNLNLISLNSNVHFLILNETLVKFKSKKVKLRIQIANNILDTSHIFLNPSINRVMRVYIVVSLQDTVKLYIIK